MTLAAWKAQIEAAYDRISQHIRKTPLDHSPLICGEDRQDAAHVYIKMENEQLTGSFKLRGAFNKLCLLTSQATSAPDEEPITASTGNHALACLCAMTKMGMKGTIVVPNTIKSAKEAALRAAGADLRLHGTDCVEGEMYARKTAQEEGRVFISPYNDPDIIAGQGTIGLEILSELPHVDAVFVSVGGGGLIGGLAAYIKAVRPTTKVIGCQPEMSKVMYESVKAGRIIDEESFDTLSDGTAGGIEHDTVTFELCRDYVDDWVMVSEEEIARAVYFMVKHHHTIVEGAAGVAIGAFQKTHTLYKNQTVAIVSCGANISVETLTDILIKNKD